MLRKSVFTCFVIVSTFTLGCNSNDTEVVVSGDEIGQYLDENPGAKEADLDIDLDAPTD